MARGDVEKAKALLIVAHGKYKSDLRIIEARTPNVSHTSLTGGGLGTFMEEENEEEEAALSPKEGSQELMLTAEMYEKEIFGEEIFSNWDFGKQKEYSCREQIMPALVSSRHCMRGKQEVHLSWLRVM